MVRKTCSREGKQKNPMTQMQQEEVIPEGISLFVQLPRIYKNCSEATDEAVEVFSAAAEPSQHMELNEQVSEESILNSSPVKNVPKSVDMHKKGWDVGNGVKQKNHFRAKAKSRPRRKKMCKDNADTSNSEVIPQKSLHCRGQFRRRCNSSDVEKLDSKTFECYRENMWQKFPEERRSLFACLDSLYYHMHTNKADKVKVLNWVKKKDIFSKTYVFVPIVQWGHWSLLIICNIGNSFESKSKSPCLLLLDSMQEAHANQMEPGIRKFVFDIYSTGERTVTTEMIRKIPFRIPKVPQQKNSGDCGYYVLYYISRFLELAPEDFSLCEGYPYSLKEDWFTTEELDCFCKELKCSEELSSSDSESIELLEECCIS